MGIYCLFRRLPGGYRFSPEELEEGGLRLEHTFALLDVLCSSEINYLHVSLDRFDRTSYFGDTVSLEDRDFKVTLGTWLDQNGGEIKVPPRITGTVASFGSDSILLTEHVWKLVSEVAKLYQTPPEKRDGTINRRAWARMREHAVEAGAPLGDFLLKTIVLTPNKVKLGLRNTEVPGALTLQVEPTFEGAPDRWLEFFDRSPEIPERYDTSLAMRLRRSQAIPKAKQNRRSGSHSCCAATSTMSIKGRCRRHCLLQEEAPRS